MKIRRSSLFDMDSIAPLGSKTWAEESRKAIQDAVDGTVDGKIRLTNAMRYFWKNKGWEKLEDQHGKKFITMRKFALAERPHGLHMTLQMYKAFIKDMGKTMEETADQADVDIRERPQGKHTDRSSVYSTDDLSGGTSSDKLARRLARDHRHIFDRMKAGEFKSVHAAAKVAGIIKPDTPEQAIQKAWKKASVEDRMRIVSWIKDQLQADPDLSERLP